MRFIGSVPLAWNGQFAFKIRNKITSFVVPSKKSLAIYGDFRYVEFYQDFAGGVWARRPTGRQEKLQKPYVIVTRTSQGLNVEEVLDNTI